MKNCSGRVRTKIVAAFRPIALNPWSKDKNPLWVSFYNSPLLIVFMKGNLQTGVEAGVPLMETHLTTCCLGHLYLYKQSYFQVFYWFKVEMKGLTGTIKFDQVKFFIYYLQTLTIKVISLFILSMVWEATLS